MGSRTGGYLLLILAAMAWSACVYDHFEQKTTSPTCDPAHPTSFLAIQPIINAKCATNGCHDASGSNGNALTTMAQVQGNTLSILYQLDHKVMPPANQPQLTAAEFLEIECWINQGATTP